MYWATTYFLVYGNEVVIPIEVEILHLRTIHEAELSDAKWIRIRSENIALIGGRRINVLCLGQLYENRKVELSTSRLNPQISNLGNMF